MTWGSLGADATPRSARMWRRCAAGAVPACAGRGPRVRRGRRGAANNGWQAEAGGGGGGLQAGRLAAGWQAPAEQRNAKHAHTLVAAKPRDLITAKLFHALLLMLHCSVIPATADDQRAERQRDRPVPRGRPNLQALSLHLPQLGEATGGRAGCWPARVVPGTARAALLRLQHAVPTSPHHPTPSPDPPFT